jgi:hypothetical protein
VERRRVGDPVWSSPTSNSSARDESTTARVLNVTRHDLPQRVEHRGVAPAHAAERTCDLKLHANGWIVRHAQQPARDVRIGQIVLGEPHRMLAHNRIRVFERLEHSLRVERTKPFERPQCMKPGRRRGIHLSNRGLQGCHDGQILPLDNEPLGRRTPPGIRVRKVLNKLR